MAAVAKIEGETRHAENFSLKDFFEVGGATLQERVEPFSMYARGEAALGRALYCREVASAADHRVSVVDPLDGRTRDMVMLGSNNYLGLATHPDVTAAAKRAIDEFGVGMGGPPLLNGMSRLHRELERAVAELKECEDALLFASGYQANVGWVGALLRPGDVLLYDELSHASLYDGVRLAGVAGARLRAVRFRHNDCDHLEALLGKWSPGPRGQVFVAVEGVYSMDGDLAPLRDVRALCDRFGASLVVDDAHGTGVMGEHGGGTAQHFGLGQRVEVEMGTFSKTFATTGGFVAGTREVVDYLRFFARSYMFSAHLPPPVVGAVLAGIRVIQREPERRRRLHESVRYLVEGLRAIGFDVAAEAAVVPVRVPPSVDIRALARRFHEENVFLNSIEYPAVPLDEQRLRVSVMATHTREDLDHALAVFRTMSREFPLLSGRAAP